MTSLDFMNLLVGWHYDGLKNLSQAGMQLKRLTTKLKMLGLKVREDFRKEEFTCE